MWFCLPTPFLPNTLFERQTQKGSKMWRLWAKIQDRISRILKLATATIECPAMSFVFVTNENEKYKSVRRSSIWLSLGDDDQGPANTRYSTQTRNCLSYSNLARTKHYLDRVVSIINSRIFTIISTIIQKQPAMEKIFQDNYSKSWYSNAAVHGKDEQWFEC